MTNTNNGGQAATTHQNQPAQALDNKDGQPLYSRLARATATLHRLTPGGTPVDITVSAGTTKEELMTLLTTAATAGKTAIMAGWSVAQEEVAK